MSRQTYACVKRLPLSGMMSLQGRAKGVIECWQTSAVKLPEKQYRCRINTAGRFNALSPHRCLVFNTSHKVSGCFYIE